MNLHIITEHTHLHHKALACLMLMEAATCTNERVQYAAKYAGFMKQLCTKGIERALETIDEDEVHPLMAEAITAGLNNQEVYNNKQAMKIVEEVS